MRRLRIILYILLLISSPIAAKGLRLFSYPADSAANTGIAVIVCPGGSYCWHDMEHEGIAVIAINIIIISDYFFFDFFFLYYLWFSI